MAKKSLKKVTEKKFGPLEITESKGPINIKIIESEDKADNQKFLEFLSVSTKPIETLASKKPRNARPIEEDEEILSVNTREENKDEKKKETDYFAKTSRDYNLVSPREEKKQDISMRSFQPQRVNISEMGREMRTPLRETFIPQNEMNRLASPGRGDREEKKYDVERVDFTEVGREKRYKLMK
jgi:hypothetical protein